LLNIKLLGILCDIRCCRFGHINWNFRRAAFSFVIAVCPYEKLFSQYMNFHDILYLNIFWKLPEKIQFLLASNKNNVTLNENLCTFMISSGWIHLKIRNIYDKRCRETLQFINQRKHIISHKTLLKHFKPLRYVSILSDHHQGALFLLSQHLVCKYELNCEDCSIKLARNKVPWWWSDRIETYRSVLKCLKVFYVKLYVHSLVDKLKWFYENAWC